METIRELGSDDLRTTHWLGEVVDNKDPEFLGRCKVKIYGKFDLLATADIPWAFPMNRSNPGQHVVPRIGDIVAARFDNGNIYMPEYWVHVEQNKNLKDDILKSASEPHNVVSLVYDAERNIRIYWSKEDGLVISTGTTKDKSPMIRFDDKGDILINADNIYMSTSKTDKSEPAVNGETLYKTLKKFMEEFNKHTHPTPAGPSSPPLPTSVIVVKGELSKLVKIKHKK